jgi:hypothetical protein
MYISMLKQLFDDDLFENNRIKINKKCYYYTTINKDIYNKHNDIITKVSYYNLFNIDFID